MINSKLTSKARTTIPEPVRTALDLKPGDQISYVIQCGRVIVSKAPDQRMFEDPFRTFTEWASEIDRRAYRDL